MHLLGLACGSPGGNSEILLKAAMMGAESDALSVELVRVNDLVIPGGRPGTLPPSVRDDRPWIIEKLLVCDALIIAAPVYTRSPPGTLKLLMDRAFGPQVDTASALRVRTGQRNDDPRYQTTVIDDRLLKPRVGALLSVGGATSADWVTFGLPLLHQATFSTHIAIVDQFQVLGFGMPGSVLFDPAQIARAEALGRNVAAEVGRAFDDAIYHGAPGICPICHCDLIVPHAVDFECATCAARGKLIQDADGTHLDVSVEGRAASILTLAGKDHHQAEIDRVSASHMQRRAELPPLRARFDAVDRLSTPPGS
jgi:multimeric flavodoxin WrbA